MNDFETEQAMEHYKAMLEDAKAAAREFDMTMYHLVNNQHRLSRRIAELEAQMVKLTAEVARHDG
jgi:hypothetical protein